MRRLVSVVVAIIAMLGGGQQAWSGSGGSGQALERAALRLVNTTDHTVVMAQGDPVMTRPDRPLDVWMWAFNRKPVSAGGVLSFDATTTRYKVDCDTGRQLLTGRRAYLFGRLVHGADASGSPRTAQSAVAQLAAKIACEPHFKADAERYQNHTAATAAARKLFAEKEAKVQSKARSHGPFRVIRTFDDMLLMAEGAAQTSPPATVRLRWWAFLAEPQVEDGAEIADILATTYRIECSANKLQRVKLELFLDGWIGNVVDTEDAPKTADSAADALIIRAACDPKFEVDAQVLRDLNTARSAAAHHFRTKGLNGGRGMSADASDALRAGGPLRVLSSGVETVYALAGAPPFSPPHAPIERWQWSFFNKTRSADSDRFDSHATLVRIDCAALAAEGIRREYVLNGDLVKAEVISSPPTRYDKDGSLGHAVVQAACDPHYGKQPRYFVDYAAAKRIVTEAFNTTQAKAKKPEAVATRRTGPGRKAQPIRFTGPGADRSSDSVSMTEGPAPKAWPQRPVEMWTWTFKSKSAAAKGPWRSNSDALLLRVDCQAGTQQSLAAEYYADGKLVSEVDYAVTPPQDPEHARPIKASQWLLDAACSPDYKMDARVFPNRQAAQAAAGLMLLEQHLQRLSKAAQDVAPIISETIAGEAVRAVGLLRVIGRNAATRSFFMAVGSAPKVTPTQPREIWIWEFSQKARAIDGKAAYDAWATRVRVDCAARTVRPQLREGYRDGNLHASWELTGKPRKPVGRSLDTFVFSAACEPAFAADGQRFRDHRAARAAASRTKFAPRGR